MFLPVVPVRDLRTADVQDKTDEKARAGPGITPSVPSCMSVLPTIARKGALETILPGSKRRASPGRKSRKPA
jgi:hypothetical protein